MCVAAEVTSYPPATSEIKQPSEFLRTIIDKIIKEFRC